MFVSVQAAFLDKIFLFVSLRSDRPGKICGYFHCNAFPLGLLSLAPIYLANPLKKFMFLDVNGCKSIFVILVKLLLLIVKRKL